jgi:hypothetical protein
VLKGVGNLTQHTNTMIPLVIFGRTQSHQGEILNSNVIPCVEVQPLVGIKSIIRDPCYNAFKQTEVPNVSTHVYENVVPCLELNPLVGGMSTSRDPCSHVFNQTDFGKQINSTQVDGNVLFCHELKPLVGGKSSNCDPCCNLFNQIEVIKDSAQVVKNPG